MCRRPTPLPELGPEGRPGRASLTPLACGSASQPTPRRPGPHHPTCMSKQGDDGLFYCGFAKGKKQKDSSVLLLHHVCCLHFGRFSFPCLQFRYLLLTVSSSALQLLVGGRLLWARRPWV